MLVLSRRIGESIIIGNTVRITVVDIGQGRVKIGVMAPDNVSIDREEIHDRKQSEKDLRSVEVDVAVPVTVHNRLKRLVDGCGPSSKSLGQTSGSEDNDNGFRSKPR